MESPKSSSSPVVSASDPPHPGLSRSSSKGSHLSLDLSNVPPLIPPSPPTNTLLITNLQNPATFDPSALAEIRQTLANYANLRHFAPLRSFRRILITFSSSEEALAVREALDGSTILGDRIRVYFGENTPETTGVEHLQAPESKKLFFISPPPSPPHGWEQTTEDPPNSIVVAEDLAHALAQLHCSRGGENADLEEVRDMDVDGGKENSTSPGRKVDRRSRSASLLLIQPEGGKPGISVDDYTEDGDGGMGIPDSPGGPRWKPVEMPHTKRPPVELMEH